MKRAEIYLQELARAWWRELKSTYKSESLMKRLKSPQSIANKFCQWNYLCKDLGDKEREEHLLKGDDILMETYEPRTFAQSVINDPQGSYQWLVV